MVELKLSQGAKPATAACCGPKVTAEIAEARGVPVGTDCVSPSAHSAFPPIEMMRSSPLRDLSGGKPTGFKLCIGHPGKWFAIAKAMLETGIVPDFIVVDGAEAAPAPRRWSSPTTVGAPLREGCCWCTTRWWA